MSPKNIIANRAWINFLFLTTHFSMRYYKVIVKDKEIVTKVTMLSTLL